MVLLWFPMFSWQNPIVSWQNLIENPMTWRKTLCQVRTKATSYPPSRVCDLARSIRHGEKKRRPSLDGGLELFIFFHMLGTIIRFD